MLTVGSGAAVDQTQASRYQALLQQLKSGNDNNPIKAKLDSSRDIAESVLGGLQLENRPLTWADGSPIVAHGQPVYAFQATPEQFADSNLFNAPYQGNQGSASWANVYQAVQQYGQAQANAHAGEIGTFKGQEDSQGYLRDALGNLVGDQVIRDTTIEETLLGGGPAGKAAGTTAGRVAKELGETISGWVEAKLAAKGAATTWKGSGPTPGVLGLEPASVSSKAIQNYYPSTKSGSIEFVFDTKTQTFVVGKPNVTTPGLSPHEQLAKSISSSESSSIVGGMFRRGPSGEFITNEFSGHYWQNWNPETRSAFEKAMSGYGVKVEHRPGM